MKHLTRFFFLIVILAALLTLPALAAENEQLYFRAYSFGQDGLTLSETVQTSVAVSLGDPCWGVFYTSADATPASQVPAGSISGGYGFSVSPWGTGDLPQDMMEIAAWVHADGSAASGTLSYRVGGTTYSIPVSLSLPKTAFYKTKERSFETIWQKALPYGTDGDGAPLSTYFLVPEGCTITELEENLSFLEVTLSDDKTYATVTVINDGFVTGQQYRFVYELSDGTSTDIWFYVEDRSPRLMCSYTYGNDTFFSTLSGQIGMGESYRVYYVSGYEETPIPLSYLKLPTSVLSAEMLDDPYSFWINFHGATDPDQDEAICYELDGTTLRLPVEVSLPTVGFYSAPTRSAETVLSDALIGPIGEMATCYVIWDPTVIGNATNIIFMEGKEGDVQTTVSLTEETIINDGAVVITPELSEHRLRIEVKIGNKQRIGISVNYFTSTIFTTNGPSYVWGLGNRGTVLYQDQLYTVDFAFLNYEDALYLKLPGTLFTEKGEDLEHLLFVGALRDYNTPNAIEATPDFYECIQSLEVTVTNCYKLDGTPAPDGFCTVSETESYRFHGCDTVSARLQADHGNYFIACVNATMVFQEPGKTAQTVTFAVVYAYNDPADEGWLTLKMDDSLTTQQVNAILASNDTLADWLEAEHGETWGYLKAAGLLASDIPIYGGNTYINIELPAKPFDGILRAGIDCIIFNETYNVHLQFLTGATNAEGELLTVLPGLELTGRLFLESVAFRADPNCTMTYAGETFTCGVLASGDGETNQLYSSVSQCTFDGFDYGLRATPTGGVSCRWHNTLRNCEVGYLLDNTDYDSVMDGISECDFIGCGTAFRLVSLPTKESPYYYRVNDCNFVGNDIDIDVSQEGRFYFHRNFFGGLKDPHKLSAAAQDVYYRTARVRNHNVAMVITNPRVFWRNGERRFCIDPTPGLLTWIINNEAEQMEADSVQLDSDLSAAEQPLDVTVVDGDENKLGIWTIDNGAQTQSLSLLSGENTPFNAGLTFGEDDAGNQTVTVKDSSLFIGRQTVLTIPCAFECAKVLFEGEEVSSTTTDGQVTFTVAAGGTYTILENGAPLHDGLQSSGLLFRDYGENRYVEAAVRGDTITLTAKYQSVVGSKGTLMLAVYSSTGRMLGLTQQAVAPVSAGETSVEVEVDSFSFTGPETITVKAFFLEADETLAPQVPTLFENEVFLSLS